MVYKPTYNWGAPPCVETPAFLAHGFMDFHGVLYVYWRGTDDNQARKIPHEGFCQLIAFPLITPKKMGYQAINSHQVSSRYIPNYNARAPGGNIHVFIFQSWARRSFTFVWVQGQVCFAMKLLNVSLIEVILLHGLH